MRPLIIFYILVFYILVQFIWWSYLLIDLNYEILQQNIEITELRDPIGAAGDILTTNFKKEFSKKKMMVLGEGFVFLCLLVLGIVKTHQSFSKEYNLAKQQQNFMQAITHELKSPLAAIKLNIETLKRHNLDEAKREKLLYYADKETDRLNNLVGNILYATQFDSDKFALVNERFDLSECVEEVIGSKNVLSSENITIRSDIEKDIYIYGDKISIKSVLLNLIENAVKYSEESTEINVVLKSQGKEILLEVSDLGPGIPNSEKGKIFKKFYRIGSEITRKTKGTGLGLYIVQRIVHEHKGKIKVKDKLPRGSKFEIIFPNHH